MMKPKNPGMTGLSQAKLKGGLSRGTPARGVSKGPSIGRPAPPVTKGPTPRKTGR